MASTNKMYLHLASVLSSLLKCLTASYLEMCIDNLSFINTIVIVR